MALLHLLKLDSCQCKVAVTFGKRYRFFKMHFGRNAEAVNFFPSFFLTRINWTFPDPAVLTLSSILALTYRRRWRLFGRSGSTSADRNRRSRLTTPTLLQQPLPRQPPSVMWTSCTTTWTAQRRISCPL